MAETGDARKFDAAEGGLSPDDMGMLRREQFMDALAVARQDHDPCARWEEFCESAWREAALAFGFVQREPWWTSPDSPQAQQRASQRDRDGNA